MQQEMSSCSVCGENHGTHRCDELYMEIRALKDPQPTGPRGQDEDDALNLNLIRHPVHDKIIITPYQHLNSLTGCQKCSGCHRRTNSRNVLNCCKT